MNYTKTTTVRLNNLVRIAEFECESLYFVRGSSIYEIREIDSTKKIGYYTATHGICIRYYTAKVSGVKKIPKH